MNIPSCGLLPLFSFLLLSFSLATSSRIHHHHHHRSFLHCLSLYGNSSSISKVIYTKANSSYTSILEAPVENHRFLTSETPKPFVIVTPTQNSHIQTALLCSKKNGMQIRVRSGGHDYEGLSYVSHVPFVVIDMKNLRSVDIDMTAKTAWVHAGAIIGELYYSIAQKSRTIGFPAGVCPTVGMGGHLSGGGWGVLFRKYGLAADNVIDARLVDVNGRILNRKTMGEDLFWAIRGGGAGGSFGIVLAWKVNLVPVPPTVAVFAIDRTPDQNMTKLVHQWQNIANKAPPELFSRVDIRMVNSSIAQGNRTIRATFHALYLGRANELLTLMQDIFPDLGVKKQDCLEMSWIESTLYAVGFPFKGPLEVLLRRTPMPRGFLKSKSDYVREPISESGLEGIWRRFYARGIEDPTMFWTAFGGRMDEIKDSVLPFPHRAGNLYQVQYLVTWKGQGDATSQRHISWVRELYRYMTPLVSKSPRASYINYRDLDIGTNNIKGKTSYHEASIWGHKYFKNNFKRLVHIKTKVDPDNFFKNEQSIPSLYE